VKQKNLEGRLGHRRITRDHSIWSHDHGARTWDLITLVCMFSRQLRVTCIIESGIKEGDVELAKGVID